MNTTLNSTSISLPEIVNEPEKRKQWWDNLEDQWKRAFHQAVLGTGDTIDTPSDEQLIAIWTNPNLRFVGPSGPYSNLNFQLTNLSGIKGMTHLNILIASFHQIKSIDEVSTIPDLQSLFLHSNEIGDLNPIKELIQLENLYIQNNQISKIEALRSLTNLHTVYLVNNPLVSLEGITENHSQKLTKFYVLPNDNLPQKEVIRCENTNGVRCLKA